MYKFYVLAATVMTMSFTCIKAQSITSANGVTTIQNSAGTAGIQIDTNWQAIGGVFGTGGNLVLRANTVNSTVDTGGSFFLGGSQRGDAQKSQTIIWGNSSVSSSTRAGILIDGQDRGAGIQNYVGIGLQPGSVPAAALEVNGSIKLDTTGSGISFPDGTSLSSAAGLSSVSQTNGNASVNGVLHVSGSASPNIGTQGGYLGWNALAPGGIGETDFINQQGLGSGGFAFFNAPPPPGTAMNLLMFLTGYGNLGIGTAYPSAKLEVNGSIKLTSGMGASITFSDATVQSTAWNGVLTGGDYAESVDVSGEREDFQPGDVLVIDPSSDGKFLKSSAPYSTLVTGIYSTKPGVIGRRQLTARANMKEEVPMAMTGIVPTKVSTENGPIKPGDLLVTSSKSGYAMKGTDRSQMLGAVIGKAIGHLDAGTGVIEAVVTLQ